MPSPPLCVTPLSPTTSVACLEVIEACSTSYKQKLKYKERRKELVLLVLGTFHGCIYGMALIEESQALMLFSIYKDEFCIHPKTCCNNVCCHKLCIASAIETQGQNL